MPKTRSESQSKPRHITLAEFHEAASGGAAPEEAIVCEAFTPEIKAAEDGSRRIDFVISTDAIDRHGDVVPVLQDNVLPAAFAGEEMAALALALLGLGGLLAARSRR